LAQNFRFLTDKIPEPVKFNQALGFCAHEQVVPIPPVVDEKVKRTVNLEDSLSDRFGRRIMFVGERNTDSEPPAKGLSNIISNI
jgi:hypothetical protein